MVGILKFKINGGKQLESRLMELGPRVAQSGGDRALSAAARMIVREAKALVPVRTGDLKRSITYTRSGKGRGSNERLVLVGFRPPVSRRAHFTEYGTARSAAKPFMRPVLDARAQDALNIMAEVLAMFLEGRGSFGAMDALGDAAGDGLPVEFIGSE
jgi:HK97 gp10 family phage protein